MPRLSCKTRVTLPPGAARTSAFGEAQGFEERKEDVAVISERACFQLKTATKVSRNPPREQQEQREQMERGTGHGRGLPTLLHCYLPCLLVLVGPRHAD